MITLNLVEILMNIAGFANYSYWFLCMCFWTLYFPLFHTLLHEICHVRAALHFGCSNHQITIYNHYEDKTDVFLGIPVVYTTETDLLRHGKATYSPRNGLSDYEKYCITRAGYHYDLLILTIFFISAEIAIYPAHYAGDYGIFWSLTVLFALCAYGFLCIQLFIRDTDLYKMRTYKIHEAEQYRRSVAHQNITNWRAKRSAQTEKSAEILEFLPAEYSISNAFGIKSK